MTEPLGTVPSPVASLFGNALTAAHLILILLDVGGLILLDVGGTHEISLFSEEFRSLMDRQEVTATPMAMRETGVFFLREATGRGLMPTSAEQRVMSLIRRGLQ